VHPDKHNQADPAEKLLWNAAQLRLTEIVKLMRDDGRRSFYDRESRPSKPISSIHTISSGKMSSLLIRFQNTSILCWHCCAGMTDSFLRFSPRYLSQREKVDTSGMRSG